MKRQIRRGCFETNSSSTHAICIATDDVLNIPKDIHFGFGDFGWECDMYSSIRAKANYLYTCLPYVAEDYDTLIKYVTFIYNTLKSHGVENITMDNFEIGVGSWGSDIDFYIQPANDCYVDHGNEADEFVIAVCTDEDKLLHYLFSNKSYVETGNDNDDYDVDIKVDYPHEEYYKGN